MLRVVEPAGSVGRRDRPPRRRPRPRTSDRAAGRRPADAAALRAASPPASRGLRADLEALVRIPSVSSADLRPGARRRAAPTRSRELLREAGLPEVQVLTATRRRRPGQPARRRRPPPGAATAPRPCCSTPTTTSSRPARPATGTPTRSSPIERDGRLYGRGAADDKAGIVAHLGALRALRRRRSPSASRSSSRARRRSARRRSSTSCTTHRDLLAADVIVVADSVNWKVGVPALTTSLRGLVDCVVEVARRSTTRSTPACTAAPILDALTAARAPARHPARRRGRRRGRRPGHRAPEPTRRLRRGGPARRRLACCPASGWSGTGSLTGRLWTKPGALGHRHRRPERRARRRTRSLPPRGPSSRCASPPGRTRRRVRRAARRTSWRNAPFGARVTVTDGELGRPWAGRRRTRRCAGVARAAYARRVGDRAGRHRRSAGRSRSSPTCSRCSPGATVLVTGRRGPGLPGARRRTSRCTSASSSRSSSPRRSCSRAARRGLTPARDGPWAAVPGACVRSTAQRWATSTARAHASDVVRERRGWRSSRGDQVGDVRGGDPRAAAGQEPAGDDAARDELVAPRVNDLLEVDDPRRPSRGPGRRDRERARRAAATAGTSSVDAATTGYQPRSRRSGRSAPRSARRLVRAMSIICR